MPEHEGYVEVWDRVYFDENNEAVRWMRSWDKGESWREVDCSIYPDGKPPFIRLIHGNVAYIENHSWVPAASEPA